MPNKPVNWPEELPLPGDIRLPLPPMPASPEDVGAWLKAYKQQYELYRTQAELDKLVIEQEKSELELAKAREEATQLEGSRKKSDMELRRVELELSEAERKELERSSEPSSAMVYTFYRNVDEASVHEAIATLGEWSRRRPGAELTVQLTSPGGLVLDGLALYDFLTTLRSRGHRVVVEVLGFAASMGAVLLQAGDERRIGANSFVMIHEVSTGAFGKVSNLEEEIKFTQRLQKRLIEILCSRSTLTPSAVRRMWHKKDVWLDATEARTMGLADTIINPV